VLLRECSLGRKAGGFQPSENAIAKPPEQQKKCYQCPDNTIPVIDILLRRLLVVHLGVGALDLDPKSWRLVNHRRVTYTCSQEVFFSKNWAIACRVLRHLYSAIAQG
jgi:hypothetical protein